METLDAVVIGAGVVGLAIARELSLSLKNVLVIDQHHSFGEETSSRNSEVIHAGLYYPQNSLKAKFCVAGKIALYQYCQSHSIGYKQLGKLLVAQNSEEFKALEKIKQQASDNDVSDLKWLSKEKAAALEPLLKAEAVLSSPSTGIIDVHQYMQALLTDLEASGGMFVGQSAFISSEVKGNLHNVKIESQGQVLTLACRFLINAGGLHSTKLAGAIEALDNEHIPELYLCRGHYFSYQGKSPFSRLIYPVPSENGLGIHASLDTGGQLKFGPDTEYISELNYGIDDNLKKKFFYEVARYFPTLREERLQPAYAGIRPKLQGPKDGFKDFDIQCEGVHQVKGLVNLFGIDSPGLTASLAIAKYVRKKLIGD